MTRKFRRTACVASGLALALALAGPAGASPGLDDYRRFRALTIDLIGRVPTRAEVAAFEEGIDLDRWIEDKLAAGAHVERLARTYLDLLRLTAAPSFRWMPDPTTLRRSKILGPDGKETYVYFRRGQRRARPETDGEFCLTEAETGLKIRMANELVPAGKAIPVDPKVWETATVRVRPWWLYEDERSASPSALYGDKWRPPAHYKPILALLEEPDGTRTVAVRVCREEAQTAETGTIFVSGRDGIVPADKLGRQSNAPGDTTYSKQHRGQPVPCRSAVGFALAADCGCGVGLWACLPGDANMKDVLGFELPVNAHLGIDQPFDRGPQPYSKWHKLWWTAEAQAMLDHVLSEDRDFRELLSGRGTWVNGPLAQLYRSSAPTMAGGPAKAFAIMGATEPLVDPSRVPVDLSPHDFDRWERVEDRGPWAAGIATTPAFLTKYASRRARAAALYTAFLCKAFVAGDAPLSPSTDPDLRRRAGCSNCHAALEPLAAYFTRIVETDFVVLSPSAYPVDNPTCKPDAQGKINRHCAAHYDPVFADATHAFLRGGYASPDRADIGPAGLGREMTASPDFAACAVSRMASAFLGRPLTSEDADLARDLESVFTRSGYRARPVVGAILRSDAYSKASVWSSAELRKGPAAAGTEDAGGAP